METYPLQSLSVDEAMQKQFKLVDIITREFRGYDILTRGDVGVVNGLNQPRTTHKAEKVLAHFFGAEAAILVRGAGTMAIRLALYAVCGSKSGKILVHQAPIYPTTQTSFELMGLDIVCADYNNLAEVEHIVQTHNIQAALIQYTRQQPADCYDIAEVIQTMKRCDHALPIITDDNYAVLKVPKIGCELGATLASFSTFKLLGPVGIGCVVGDKSYIDKIRKSNYSGGLQTQGYEALDVLKGMIYAPVSLAISAEVTEALNKALNEGVVDGVKNCFIANAQSKVLIVELEMNNACQVLQEAELLGAAPHPVGAESVYEFVPMFYRVSGTFRNSDKTLEMRMLRINPMRAGKDTVIRILKEAIRNAHTAGS